eukprot:TRINITY_DN80923_c0_g1_i1.p1 TRINITY_DN80923_c0_g1~~TRINITY_DN80923_c0_g1_i1.p1  ORF type:complete len:153 (+),score=26.94 TRINITY_DN80923_c0_g1_i1:79-537(+)
MAKSKNHTNHNQNRKDHRNGIKPLKRMSRIPTRQLDQLTKDLVREQKAEFKRKLLALKTLYRRRPAHVKDREDKIKARDSAGAKRAKEYAEAIKQEKENIQNPSAHAAKVAKQQQSKPADMDVDYIDEAQEKKFREQVHAAMKARQGKKGGK